MIDEITRDIDIRPSSVALWFGALTGPIVFLIDLEVKYAIIQYACRNRAPWIFWLTTAVALIATVAAGFVAFRYWGSDDRRVHFMAGAGMALSAMFALAIIAMAIPDLFLHACD